MELHVEVIQQDHAKILVQYTGKYESDSGIIDVVRKLQVTMPVAANFEIAKEAIRLAVKSDFTKNRHVGQRFTMEVPD